MYLHYGKVINCVRAKTKYGDRLALNIKLDDGTKAVCWSDALDNNSYLSLKSGDSVRLIKGVKGSYSLVEDTTNTLPLAPSSRVAIAPISKSFDLLKANTNTPNDLSDILELPNLSDVDKRKMMEYIRSQSKLLKFCYETVCSDFPTLEEYDARGARSLAISLLISANQARDRYLK